MGYYINPPEGTKEEFLAQHGQPLQDPKSHDFNNKEAYPVCLVDNPEMGFTAAGICYDAHELNAFTQPHDYRPKRWYTVPTDLLKPYCKII